MDTFVILVGALVLGGALWLLLLWWQERHLPRVVCLMYHRLAPADVYQRTSGTERVFTLPAAEFEKQILYLKQHGYAFVAPSDVLEMTAGRWQGGQRAVLITFDDGCHSVHEIARPILQRHGANAVSFVTLDSSSYVFHLGGLPDRRMTDEEIRGCHKAGIHIQSHTVSHRPLRGLEDAEIRRELSESKARLEQIIGGEVRFLAVPGNWWDHRVMQIAREVGYRGVFVSNPGSTRQGTRLFGLPRVNIEGQLTIEQFAAAIRPFGIAQRRAAAILKWLPGRLLGPRFWLPLRRILLTLIPGGHVSTRRVIVTAGTLMTAFLAIAFIWLLAR